MLPLGRLCEQDRRHWDGRTDLTYVGLENVTGGTGEIVLNGAADAEANGTAFVFDSRHVLYGKLRPYLNKVAEPDFAGRCSTELIPLLPARGVDRRFLASLLRHPRVLTEATGRNTGSRMPRADMRVLFDLPVPLPPLDEQRRIVDLLNRAAGVRRLREAALAKARETIPALFLSMFGDPATNPMGWPVVPVGELLARKPNYGSMRKPDAAATAWLDLRVGNIRPGHLDLMDRKFVELPEAEQDRHTVEDGDILLVRAIGSHQHLGKAAVAYPNGARWAFDSHLMRLRLDRTRAEPDFLVQLLTTPGGRAILMQRSRSSAVQFNLNAGEVCETAVILPPLAQQREFADRLADLRSIITQQERALAIARDTERALMARLLG